MSSHMFILMKQGVWYCVHLVGKKRLSELPRSRDFQVPELRFEPRSLRVCCSPMYLTRLPSSSCLSSLFPKTFRKPHQMPPWIFRGGRSGQVRPEPLNTAAGWVRHVRPGMQGEAEGMRFESPRATEPLALGAPHLGGSLLSLRPGSLGWSWSFL